MKVKDISGGMRRTSPSSLKDRFHNVNSNKNIIYINLQKPTVRRRSYNKKMQLQETYNQPSDLQPTVYRPIIYDNSQPNIDRPIDNKEKYILNRGVEKSFITMGKPDEVVDVESNIDEIRDKENELKGLNGNVTVTNKKVNITPTKSQSPQINFDDIPIQDVIYEDAPIKVKKPRGRPPKVYSSHEEIMQKYENDKQKRKEANDKRKRAKQLKELEDKQEQLKRSQTPKPSQEEIRAIRQQNFEPYVMSRTASNFR